MIITRENVKEEASNLNDEILNRVFYDVDEEVPPENAGEPFKKMLVKEVVENEH